MGYLTTEKEPVCATHTVLIYCAAENQKNGWLGLQPSENPSEPQFFCQPKDQTLDNCFLLHNCRLGWRTLVLKCNSQSLTS
jgi:hypothetical protein